MTRCFSCDQKLVLVRPGAPAVHLAPACGGWWDAVKADMAIRGEELS
jgi:hypothetical protein